MTNDKAHLGQTWKCSGTERPSQPKMRVSNRPAKVAKAVEGQDGDGRTQPPQELRKHVDEGGVPVAVEDQGGAQHSCRVQGCACEGAACRAVGDEDRRVGFGVGRGAATVTMPPEMCPSSLPQPVPLLVMAGSAVQEPNRGLCQWDDSKESCLADWLLCGNKASANADEASMGAVCS